jgi:hypothetical protein
MYREQDDLAIGRLPLDLCLSSDTMNAQRFVKLIQPFLYTVLVLITDRAGSGHCISIEVGTKRIVNA